MTYHTARADGFSLEGNLAINTAESGESLASYLKVSGGTVTIIDNKFFGSNTTDQASLKSASSGYKLALADSLEVAYFDNPRFKIGDTLATYTFAGVDSVGISENENTGVLTYHASTASSFSFLNDTVSGVAGEDKYINFNAPGVNADDFFEVAKDSKQVTVKAAALNAIQAKDAVLSLASGSSDYTLKFADGIFDPNNPYVSETTFTTLGGSDVASISHYQFTTQGMSVKSGYVYDTLKGVSETDSILTYRGVSDKVSLVATGVTLSTDPASVGTLYSFKDSVLSINDSVAFTGLSQGDSLTIAEGYKLSISGNNVVLDENDTINTAKKFDGKTLTYTGVGASEYGFSTITNGYTYNEKYDQFAFASVEGGLAFNSDDTAVANAISISTLTSGKRITIGLSAFDTTNLSSGQYISLSANSVKEGYQLNRGSDLTTATYREANFNRATNYYNWRTEGGSNRAGYTLTDNNTKITFWDKSRNIHFNNDGIRFDVNSATSNLTLDIANKVISIGSGAFDENQEGSATLAITYFDGDETSLSEYKLALGADVSLASGEKELTANFGKGSADTLYTYRGIGADTLGYNLEDNKVTYYGEAKKFTLAGDISFNTLSGATQADSDKYFTFDGTTLNVNAAAINENGLANGKYFKLDSTDYTLALGDSMNAVTDVNKNTTVTGTAYTGVGVTSGNEAGYLNESGTFIYYNVADKFSLESGGIQFETGLTSEQLDAAISVTGGEDGKKAIQISNATVFSGLSNAATLGLAAGSKSSYALQLVNGDNLTTLGAAGVYKEVTLTSAETGKYTYASVGSASDAGFLTEDGVITYYAKAFTLDLTGNLTLKTGNDFNATNFAYNADSSVMTIFKEALGVKDSQLSGTESIAVASGYTLALGAREGGEIWTTTSLSTANSFGTINPAATGNKAYEYKFAGAENDGYTLNTAQNALTYYKAADRFTLEGNVAIVDNALESGYINVDKNTNSVTLWNERAFSSLGQGSTLSIVNAENQTAKYKLALDSEIATVSDTHDSISFNGTTYNGIGAEKAGFKASDTLLTYYQKADNFTFESGVALNSLPAGIDPGTFFSIGTGDKKDVSIHSAAIKLDSLSGLGTQVLKLNADSAANYNLVFASDSSSLVSTDINTTATLSATTYGGVGYFGDNNFGAFLANNNEYTFYEVRKSFNLVEEKSNDTICNINFATSGLTSTDVANAFEFGTIGTVTAVTITSGKIFDTLTLVNEAVLSLASDSASNYKLFLGADNDTASLNVLEIGQIHTAQTLTGSGTTYTYTGVGGDEAGFYQKDADSNITYYTASEKFTIESDIPLSISASNFFKNFIVDAKNNIVTINAAAFDFSSVESGATFKITTSEDKAYTIVLGTGLSSAASSASASWDNNIWTAAGYTLGSGILANFSGNNSSVISYNAPAATVGFAEQGITLSSPASNISLNGSSVVLNSGIYTVTPTEGAYISLAGASAEKYSLDASKLTFDYNKYHDTASLASAGNDSYNYTGAGMSSVAGFVQSGEDIVTWHKKADEFSFTANGISLTSNADGIGVDGTVVSISKDALTGTTWANGAYISLASDKYSMTLGTGLTQSGEYKKATITTEGYTRTFSFSSEGAESEGYSVVGGNKLFYYTKPEEVGFTGSLVFAEGAADSIHINNKEVTVDKAALSLASAQNGDSLSVVRTAAGYRLVIGDLTSLASSQIHDQASFDTSTKTYNGIGAEKKGFLYDSSSAGKITYYKDNNRFVFDDSSTFTFATANSTTAASWFTITPATEDGQATVAINQSAFATLTNGNTLVLGANYASLYDLEIAGKSAIASTDVFNVDAFATTESAFEYTIKGGAKSEGYVREETTNKETLTYYTEADKFTLGAAEGGTVIPFVTDITSIADLDGLLEVNTTNHTITIGRYFIDEKKTLEEGQTLTITGMTTLTGGVKYTLVKDSSLTDSGSAIDEAFNNATKVYNTKGAENDGYELESGIITYHKAAKRVSLDGTASFVSVSSASVGTYFSFENDIFTIKNISAFASLSAGNNVSLAAGSNYTLAFGDTLTLSSASIHSSKGFDATNKIFTGIGADDTGFASANNVFTYYEKADKVKFDGNLAFNTNTLTAADNIVITKLNDTLKTITFGANAFSNMSNGQVVSIASGDTYKDYQIAGTQSSLSSVTSYHANAVFQSLSSNSYAYYGAGASNDGFAVDTVSSGANVLTYYTQRKDEFTLGGGIKFASITSAETSGGYFTVSANEDDQGYKNVTVDKSLFATSGQTDGATLSVDGKYHLRLNANDEVSLNTTAQLTSSDDKNYAYQGVGAIGENGFNDDTGVITYYAAAATFTLAANDTGKISLNAAPGTNLSNWLAVNGKMVSILSGAVSTSQESGATLGFAAGTTDYTLDGSALFVSGNEYSSAASFANGESGGGTYTSEGMSKENGYTSYNNVLTYFKASDTVGFAGGIFFNTLEAGTAVNDAIKFDGENVTIDGSKAFASEQKNFATLGVVGDYGLVFNGTTLGTDGYSTVASITRNKYTGAGATGNAGYAFADSVLTYYGTPDTFTFNGSAVFATDINTKLAAGNDTLIVVAKKTDSTVKTVTFYKDAFATNLQNGRSTFKINTDGYELVFADDINGGEYDGETEALRISKADETGTKTYTYKFGGATKDGFVFNASNNYYTYYLKSDQIIFEGNINFAETFANDPTLLAEHFNTDSIGSDGIRIITIDSSKETGSVNIFGANYDNATLKLSDDSAKSYKLEIGNLTPTVVGEKDNIDLTQNENGGHWRNCSWLQS